jgi:hypothetical protein
MKKLLFGSFIALLSFSFAACDDSDDDNDDNLSGIDISNKKFSCDDDIDDNDRHAPVKLEDLPADVKTYLDKNFPGLKIGVAFIDDDEDNLDVYVLQGDRWRELEFDKDGFEGFEDEGISVGVLPKNIVDCIEQRFPGAVMQIAYLKDDDDLAVYILHNNKLIQLKFDD